MFSLITHCTTDRLVSHKVIGVIMIEWTAQRATVYFFICCTLWFHIYLKHCIIFIRVRAQYVSVSRFNFSCVIAVCSHSVLYEVKLVHFPGLWLVSILLNVIMYNKVKTLRFNRFLIWGSHCGETKEHYLSTLI